MEKKRLTVLSAARARAFLDCVKDQNDRLGMVVLPVLLGTGIPLFATEGTTFSNDTWAASQAAPAGATPRSLLRPDRHRAFPDDAIELVYEAET
jgi:hypothetical protein